MSDGGAAQRPEGRRAANVQRGAVGGGCREKTQRLITTEEAGRGCYGKSAEGKGRQGATTSYL